MKNVVFISSVFWIITLFSNSAISQESVAKSGPDKCDVGPLNKKFGTSSWLVYSCSDGKSVVIVSAPGSPAMPFVFAFVPQGTGYQLSGEGTGNREATTAAFDDLGQLNEKDVAALIQETKAHNNQLRSP